MGSNDVTFLDPIASHNSADAYLESNEQLQSTYGIKKVSYETRKILVDGDDVCAFFDFSIWSLQYCLHVDGFIWLTGK
jgi:hypothetical protein